MGELRPKYHEGQLVMCWDGIAWVGPFRIVRYYGFFPTDYPGEDPGHNWELDDGDVCDEDSMRRYIPPEQAADAEFQKWLRNELHCSESLANG